MWSKGIHLCECQDWLNYKLTGEFVASGCNVGARWHWDADVACRRGAGCTDGRPMSLLKLIGLEDAVRGWVGECTHPVNISYSIRVGIFNIPL